MKRPITALLCFVLLPSALLAGPDVSSGGSWPQWRGPLASGVAPGADPPVTWSETQNVRWKRPIPGRGHASPVVWGDLVFLLTAVAIDAPHAAEGEVAKGERPRGVSPAGPIRLTVLAIDRSSGEVVWERVAREEVPHEGTHADGSWASASAATDGEVLIAHFGSRGLYAYDLEGELLWSTDFGDMTTRRGFGEGGTPLLAGETLIVNWDHEGESFVVALESRTGREIWRQVRDEPTTWATPIVVEVEGRQQVIVNGTGRSRSYDLATGESLWEAGGQTVNAIPSPVSANGLVYLTSGFRASAFKAIRLAGAQGDVTDTEAIVWSYDQDTPYVPSPLLYENQIYFLKVNTGILTSLDATSGEVVYGPERLPGINGVYASPVAAAGRVYVVGRNGRTVVLRHGPGFEVLAENSLDDDFSASPAVVDGEIYLRGHSYLYCLAVSATSDVP